MDMALVIFIVIYVIIDISNSLTFRKEMYVEIDYFRYEIDNARKEKEALELKTKKNEQELRELKIAVEQHSVLIKKMGHEKT